MGEIDGCNHSFGRGGFSNFVQDCIPSLACLDAFVGAVWKRTFIFFNFLFTWWGVKSDHRPTGARDQRGKTGN